MLSVLLWFFLKAKTILCCCRSILSSNRQVIYSIDYQYALVLSVRSEKLEATKVHYLYSSRPLLRRRRTPESAAECHIPNPKIWSGLGIRRPEFPSLIRTGDMASKNRKISNFRLFRVVLSMSNTFSAQSTLFEDVDLPIGTSRIWTSGTSDKNACIDPTSETCTPTSWL